MAGLWSADGCQRQSSACWRASLRPVLDTGGPGAQPELPERRRAAERKPGRFIIEGTLRHPGNVTEVRPAQPLDGNPGGWPEYVIDNSYEAVEVSRVGGVNEPWTQQPGDWES